jgi:O-antigen/teichoic acid export membrane protein
MEAIAKYTKKVYSKRIFKDLSIVFTENIITKALNFIIILVLTRKLGPTEYGKYSYMYVFIGFFSSFLDFGMENTAVRFSSKYKELKDNIFGIYVTALFLVMTFAIVFFTVFHKQYLVSMHKQELNIFFTVVMISLFGESFIYVNDTYLQAVQKFKFRAAINISRYVGTLSFVAILIFTNNINLHFVTYIFYVPVIMTLFFIRRYITFIKSIIGYVFDKNILKKIIKYQMWMLFMSMANNILSRLDIIMLSFWVSFKEIGTYNAAFQLTSIVSFLPYVLGKVLLPKFAEKNQKDVCKIAVKSMKITSIIGLLILAFIPLVPAIVKFLLGEKYLDAMAITQILLISFDLSMVFLPIEQTMYAMDNPKALSIGKYVQIIILIILNILFIPRFGYVFAAINVLATRVIYCVIITKLFLKHRQKLIN